MPQVKIFKEKEESFCLSGDEPMPSFATHWEAMKMKMYYLN